MFSQKKPYSAVTVKIENLTSEAYEEDDLSGIPDLVEVITLQASGPTEAARALRKKLKYGNVHRQLRALTLLDGLIQNAGARFQRCFVDESLLERLRVCATSDLSDADVRKKCSVLFRGWAVEYKNTPGLERLARLNKELPQRKQVVTQARSKVVRETENPFDDDDDDEMPGPTPGPTPAPPPAAGPSLASSATVTPQTQTQPTGRIDSFSYLAAQDKDKDKKKKKDKGKKGRKPFNLEAEKPLMKTTIAEASMASIDLMNTLQSINREQERISENPKAIQRFESCKILRRKIIRYIYLVSSEEYLGSLLHANDELVTALMTFEQLDRSIDADSDSDDDLAEQAHRYRMMAEKGKDAAASPASPTSPSAASALPDLTGLSLGSASPAPSAAPASPPPVKLRAPPPRPSPMSKPPPPRTVSRRPPPSQDDSDGGDSYEDNDEDENDPFADRNEV